VADLERIIKASPCWNRSQTNVTRYVDGYAKQLAVEILSLQPKVLSVDEIKDLSYILSVLEMQYVTSYDDLNADNEMETYASLDIPEEEYQAIRDKLSSMIRISQATINEGE